MCRSTNEAYCADFCQDMIQITQMNEEGTTFSSQSRPYLQREMTFFTHSWANSVPALMNTVCMYRARCICSIQGSKKLQEQRLFWYLIQNCQKRAESTSDCLFGVRSRFTE